MDGVSYSHEATIAYGLELRLLSPGEANKLDKFRELRNGVAYRAVRATAEEAKDIFELAELLLPRLERRLSEKLRT